MRVVYVRTVDGPNVYHYRPVLIMRLDLEELAGRESYEVEGFIDRLLEALPGLHTHHCSREKAGGFVERLREGTYFGHVVEHVAIELSQHAGVGVNYGKTVYAGSPGVYDVVVRYEAEEGMRHLLYTAVALVEALVDGRPYPVEEALAEARAIIAATELGPSTRAIVEAAERRGIPWSRIGSDSLVQLGYGRHRKFIQAALSSETGQIAVDVACNKELTKQLLERAFLPVPRGAVVRTADEAVAAHERLGGSVVVKPVDGNQGRGVSIGVSTAEEVARAFDVAAAYGREVIVEEEFEGSDYRVLVVGGRMVAASRRLPCHVVGDGEHTISELVDRANEDPRRGDGHDRALTRIVLDEAVRDNLAQQGWTLDDRPAAGEWVFLRRTANLSTGGEACDVTDEVHPDVQRACERAARVIGLDICGIDLITPDIAAPFPRTKAGIVEVNAAPGLRMHHFPSEGRARDVGTAIIEMLYPGGTTGRVPIVAITGTNGKTTVTRLIGHIFGETGKQVGMTTTDGVYVGGHCVARGDMTGPQSARAILSDPSVEVAVLETARGGIQRRGLGYDWADVAVLTNIQPDHIGQDGIEDVEDLVHIKSLVAERVCEGGTLVLNADDALLVKLPEHRRVRRTPKQIVLFSLEAANEHVLRHCAGGGTAYFVRGGWIVEARGMQEEEIVDVATLPFTMQGAARFQVANCLAAVAACRARGIPPAVLRSALLSFDTNEHNAGRMNLYRLGAGHVMVDYGHNPHAFEAVSSAARTWAAGRPVIGIIGVPGDRDDALVLQAGRAAARGFDRIVIREDRDLRGRRRGEVPEMLCLAVQSVAPEKRCEVVTDECQAIEHVLEEVRQGAFAVLFYEEAEPVVCVLEANGAVPVQHAADVPAGERPLLVGDGLPGTRIEVTVRQALHRQEGRRHE